MQSTQTASLDSHKCPCFCLFDCCFIQQFLSTTPLTKLTRNPEKSLVPTLCDILQPCCVPWIFSVRLSFFCFFHSHNFILTNAIKETTINHNSERKTNNRMATLTTTNNTTTLTTSTMKSPLKHLHNRWSHLGHLVKHLTIMYSMSIWMTPRACLYKSTVMHLKRN